MSEEIKEILEELEDCKATKYLNYNLDNKDARIILNYITNLQQKVEQLEKENEFLKLSNPEMNIEHFRVVGENKRKIDMLRKENHQLKKIRKEAIEKSVNNAQPFYQYLFGDEDGKVENLDKLLNILNKGSDKDVN